MSYLIYKNEVIAKTKEQLQSGIEVRWSNVTANGSLVNAEYAKVSNAKKWDRHYNENLGAGIATLVSDTGLYPEYKI